MYRVLPFIVPLALWQLATWLVWLPPFVLPPPLSVLQTLYSEFQLLWENMLVTLAETLAGIAIGVVLGVCAAVSMTLSVSTLKLLKPSLVASQAIPVFVLAPVFTIWMGYGPEPKVAMTVLLVFFPVTSSLLDGLLGTPRSTLDLARIKRAGKWRELIWLRFPNALPHLGAGLRIAVTYAPTGAVIGEWIGASKGLGYLMLMANARMRIELMFAALIWIVAMTVVLNLLTNHLLKKFDM